MTNLTTKEEREEKPDPLIGIRLGDYLIQTLIGRGGMARVYEGFDERLGRRAAIKVMEVQHDTDEEMTQRFIREARAAGNLDHPNIVSVYQFGEQEDKLYMAMKLIEGRTLLNILKRLRQQKKYLPPEQIVSIIRQMAAALDYAHSKGVVHRDIKPSNIMLTEDNRAILTDFGLTMQLGSESTLGTAFGTPRYISPEQAIASHKAVPQSDIYSLGVVLYEMAAGQPPFDGDSPMNLALSHITNQPPAPQSLRPDLPHPVQTVILKALEKRPENRWPTATAMADALEKAYRNVEPEVTLSEDILEAPQALRDAQESSAAASLPRQGNVEQTAVTPRGASAAKKPVRRRSGSILPILILLIILGGVGFYTFNTSPQGVSGAAFVTPTSIPSARVRLIYGKDWFFIYNATGQPVNLEGISFVRNDQNSKPWEARLFGASTHKNLLAGNCLSIKMTTTDLNALPLVCNQKTAQTPTTYSDPVVIFWAMHNEQDSSEASTFSIVRNTTVLQTCSMHVNTCEFTIS